jgi:SAM-dependent methyltransferase
LALLRARGYVAVGLDGHPDYVRDLRERGFDCRLGDLEDPLPFADGEFEVVTCLEVIEHVARSERLIQEIQRVLRSDGGLVLSTPNFAFWQNRLRYLLGQGPVNEGVHLRFFTPRSLRDLLSQMGFVVSERASFAPLTGLNILLRGLGQPDRFASIPGWAEAVLAFDLVYRCGKSAQQGAAAL